MEWTVRLRAPSSGDVQPEVAWLASMEIGRIPLRGLLGLAFFGCVDARTMVERLGERIAVAGHAGQLDDALLGLAQLSVAAAEQGHALLVPGQPFLQPRFAVFQLADDALQVGQRLLERQGIGSRLRHW